MVIASAASVAVEGARVDVDVSGCNVAVGTVNIAVGVDVAVLLHPAIMSPTNNRPNKREKGFLFMGEPCVRCLGRSA